MQINTTKTGPKIKFQKRERELIQNTKSLVGEIARFGIGEMSEHADAAHDGLVQLLADIEKLEAEPAAN